MKKADSLVFQSRPKWKRLVFLLLISMFDFGSTYVYDFPSSLELVLRKKLKFTPAESLYLYSAYSLPNLVVNIIGGLLIIKFGYKSCLKLYTICVTSGQLLFAIGCLCRSYALMLLGRFLLGCGAENLMITQYYSSHQTFEPSFHTTAIGLNQSFSYLASFLGFYFLPISYLNTKNVATAAFLSCLAPLASLVCVFIFVTMKQAEDDEVEKTIKENDISDFNEEIKLKEKGGDTPEEASNERRFNNEESTLLDGGIYAIHDSKKNSNIWPSEKSFKEDDSDIFDIRTFSWKDRSQFPKIYWYLCFLPFTLACGYFQFTNICTTLITVKFHLTYKEAKNLPTIFPLTLIILLPVLSNIAEKYGKRSLYLLASSFLGVATYLFLLLSNEHHQWSKVPLMLMMGTFFSLYSCVYWTAITQVLPHHLVNIGLSIANTAQNFSNFIYPLFFGSVIQKGDSVSLQSFLKALLCLMLTSVFLTLRIVQLDYNGNKRLHKPLAD